MKKLAEALLDMRIQHNDLELGLFEGNKMVGKNGASRQSYQIYCDYQGDEIGSMMFLAYEGWPLNKIDSSIYKSNEIVDKFLYISEVRVHYKYQNLGIGQLIYKKFGEVYLEQFNGWPVGRNFVNPIAEYAFRKAVGLGWVPDAALNEQYIYRDYNKNQLEQAKELMNKLPENVRSPISAMNKQSETIRKVDYRILEFQIFDEELDNDNERVTAIDIMATFKNEYLGSIRLKVYNDSQILHLDYIEVAPNLRGVGIGGALYKKLGEVYRTQFNGWKFSVDFINPIAEYSFQKAIQQGWLPVDVIQKSDITRFYSDQEQELWDKTLQPKLKQTGSIDFRKFVVEKV